MSRTALSLDAFDPDVLDAARDVARRAGIPLETWIESVVAPDAKPDPGRRRRQAPVDEAPVDEPAVAEAPAARPSPSRPAKAAPAPRSDAVAQPVFPAARQDALGPSMEAMMRRLDALDRSLADERRHSDATATRALEAIEQRIASAFAGGDKPAGEMVERLADIERKMGELQTHLAAPRPVGRRGRPLVAEMRSAVDEVRQRQRELAAGRSPDVPAPEHDGGSPSPMIGDLRQETSRLRETLGTLATGREVGALEQTMSALATDMHRTQEPADLAAIATPIERMRAQVERLAEEVSENVHARVSGEVERLSSKVEGALGATPASAERDALTGVFGELAEIRRMIAALAGPERIQSLAQGLQAISSQIAQLQRSHAPAADDLKPLLDEIRRGLETPDASAAILGRIDALSHKMDQASLNPVGELIGRIESLGETLRRPQGEADLGGIQRMLRGLAEKIDHVGSGGSGESLDALERQVVSIAQRLDARGADPAIEGLERMMGDLLMQVSAMRDEGSVEAAVERATRRAVADAMGTDRGTDHGAAGVGGVDLLRADFADLCAQQVSADQRMQSTMSNLNVALERLVDRLGPTAPGERSGLPQRPEEAGSIAERLLASAMPVDAKAPPAAGVSVRAGTARRPEAPRLGDELLEPGAARPAQGTPAQSRPAAVDASIVTGGGDIQANFIAAARRAAHAAQADIDGPDAADARSRARTKPAAPAAPARTGGLVASLRKAIDKRRRPLLLGLAAVVLAIGAYQAFDFRGASAPGIATPGPSAAATAPVPPASTAAQKPTTTTLAQAPAAKAEPADPQTTQAIAKTEPATKAEPAAPAAKVLPQFVIPRVATTDALKADLAGVPAGLATLKQAALEGEGAAIFELATREADGRGMPRDLALAAKLFQHLATAGYAPAQFKLGSFYEKGSGVIRDLAEAKSWYEKAAGQGNIRSMHNLAVLHAENPAAGGKPDFANASAWFRRAAEYGVRDSQYNLAVLYARGLGVTQDLAQSFAWFSAAATQGDEEAGKKRDDVAGKLDPAKLAAAKSVVAAYRPKPADPAANDVPVPKAAAPIAAPAPMTLLGASAPGAPQATASTQPGRPSPRPAGTGV